jgi:cyclic-di-GMP-binding protein
VNFDLPIINPGAKPAFTDAKTCAEWLQGLPLINVGPAHGRLLGELEELNCFAMPAAERVKILELAREPVLFVQTELVRKYAGKPVPLAPSERELFHNIVALWDALADGWRHCLSELSSDNGGVSNQAALICQRVLWSTGMRIAENNKVFLDINPTLWRRVNQAFEWAEKLGVTEKNVSNPSHRAGPETSCIETFARIQLLALANPNEHGPRQQAVIARWADRWAGKVTLTSEAPRDEVAPLSVDLAAEAPASRATKSGALVRFLGTVEVGKSIRKRITALKDGQEPEELGLGADVTPGLAAQLLVMLQQQWCEDRVARQTQRRGSSSHAAVCGGIAAMHYFVTGRPFETLDPLATLTPAQQEQIQTFGQLSTRAYDDYTMAHGWALEQWRIIDESLSGFRLERPRDGGNARYLHRQLVAVRPADASAFTICSLRWMAVSENYVLQMGARVLPGAPSGVAVRIGGVNAMGEKFVPALMLPAVPALRSPSSVIVPAGWYRPRRLIELKSDDISRVILTGALERGSDFERCTFEKA